LSLVLLSLVSCLCNTAKAKHLHFPLHELARAQQQ
jgi:hypothetical protein